MLQGKKPSLYSCSACGSSFSPLSSGGICPFCHTPNPHLVEKEKIRRRRQQIRNKQIKTAITRLSIVIALVIVLIVSVTALVSNILKNNESLKFDSEDPSSAPIFYTNSDGNAYFYLKRTPYLIGNGEIFDFAYSASNGVTYAVFKGRRDTESIAESTSLLKITNGGKKIETVVESQAGSDIVFKQGGNCKYIYYLVSENLGSYQNSSRLYLYDSKTAKSIRITEYSNTGYYDNFRVSPNGRYMIYKGEDGKGTKLLKYSVKESASILLGVKNAEPISIDNKGKYYSYIKENADNKSDFFVESSVDDREKTSLDKLCADRVIVSSDSRSFIIETGNLTTVKTVGSEACVIAAKTGSGLGINIVKALTDHDDTDLTLSLVHTVSYCKNESFLPYYYVSEDINGTYMFMVCRKDGVKEELLSERFSNYCTNGTLAAYVVQNSLYTTKTAGSDATLISENFEGYTLEALSDNGKYIFYSDLDGNFYRIPYKYNGADWTKIAVDPEPYISSFDGNSAIFQSEGALHHTKNGKSVKIGDMVHASKCIVMSDASSAFYLTVSDGSKAHNAYTLYTYNGSRSSAVDHNVVSVLSYPHFVMTYSNTPYSTYVKPSLPTAN